MKAPKVARVLSALIVLLPWVIPLMVVSVQQHPGAIDLRGEWEWRDVEGATSGVVRLPVPLFSSANIAARHVVLKRSVNIEQPGDEPYLLVIGGTQLAVARVYVNGQEVGEIGVWSSKQKAEFNTLDDVQIPVDRLLAGVNVIEIEFEAPGADAAGVADRRMVLGRRSEIGAWYIRTSKLEALLRSGPLLVLPLLGLLLLALTRLNVPWAQRRQAWRALALVISSGGFLLFQTGLSLTGYLTTMQRGRLMFPLLVVATSVLVDFCLDYFDAWSARWVWVNRAVGLTLLLLAVLMPESSMPFSAYSGWSSLAIVGTVVVMIRSFRTKPSLMATLLLSAIIAFVGAGYIDVLTTLGVWQLPLLFALNVGNIPLLVGVVVLGTFLELSERNTALTKSLASANQELVGALVEAREATRLKSEFLANVSHELRTPLNSIINIPEGLLEDFTPSSGGPLEFTGDADRSARYLKTLHASGLHLLGVVNQVLDFSKIEANKMSMSFEPVSVAAVVNEVAQTIEPLAAKQQVTLRCTGALEGEFRADAVKVAQVLLNLLSNAVKFSSARGAIELRVESSPSSVSFIVIDAGIGIAPENHKLIFEGFRQVEGGSTRRFGGTGLGLAVSRRLVELHGGALTVDSALGKGATFTARFPRVPVVAAGVEGAAPSGRPCIVVIDDEALVQETLRLSLRQVNADVVVVDDPRQALEAIRQRRPQLVILDIMMPRVSGVTVLRDLRSDAVLAATAVLVLSAWPSNREVVEGLGAAWLSKPWREDELVSTVKRMLTDGVQKGVPTVM